MKQKLICDTFKLDLAQTAMQDHFRFCRLGPTAGKIFAPCFNVRPVINYAVVIPYYENQFHDGGGRRRGSRKVCHAVLSGLQIIFVTGRPAAAQYGQCRRMLN